MGLLLELFDGPRFENAYINNFLGLFLSRCGIPDELCLMRYKYFLMYLFFKIVEGNAYHILNKFMCLLD